jgi:hypothetical protein
VTANVVHQPELAAAEAAPALEQQDQRLVVLALEEHRLGPPANLVAVAQLVRTYVRSRTRVLCVVGADPRGTTCAARLWIGRAADAGRSVPGAGHTRRVSTAGIMAALLARAIVAQGIAATGFHVAASRSGVAPDKAVRICGPEVLDLQRLAELLEQDHVVVLSGTWTGVPSPAGATAPGVNGLAAALAAGLGGSWSSFPLDGAGENIGGGSRAAGGGRGASEGRASRRAASSSASP